MSLTDQTSRREGTQMTTELFGVFGGRDEFEALRSPEAFDVVLEGASVTVGVRDPRLGIEGRTTVSEDPPAAVWGEAFTPDDVDASPAEWLAASGDDALAGLNGSYVAAYERDGEAMVVTDQLRSWEVFYTDALGPRVFTTDGAALKGLLDEPTVDRQSLLEFLHLGTVLGEHSLFEGVSRIPFDGYLQADTAGELSRFVYRPRSFDYSAELADRLERAIGRRANYPGRKGLLLSAGQDSRTMLALIPDIDDCYTVGDPASQEVETARRLAQQYGAAHTTLTPDDRYLLSDDKVKYTQGIRESLHVHHAGYDDELTVDTMYHGLLYDTLFKGYFLERDGFELFGAKLPTKRLNDGVDPFNSLLDTLGFLPDGSDRIAACTADLFDDIELDDPRGFLRERLEAEYEKGRDRAESVHNAMDLLVLRNQPVMSFRTHIADCYTEAFVAADRELLEWHLSTPPRYRHRDTVERAIAALDDDIFTHRPKSQPHSSELLNQVERFVRRKVPLLTAVEPAWPDRVDIYQRYGLDDRLFPDHPDVQSLPVRHKLRVNDLRWWLS